MFDHSALLATELLHAYKDKGDDYVPRTRYLDDAGHPRYINRLIREDSPYLLQHAHNPVDWYPWGEEAFDAARVQNKPVFLSIGYSTCHWCHVMEEESFDNEELARVMNDFFVCIKVDRELHPDVDSYYMTAVMIMQGQGGWPMSSFLTPDRQPFFGATYFRPGQFMTLMHRVHELWMTRNSDLLEQAAHFSQQVADALAAKQSLNEIGINVVDLTAQALMNQHDPQHGGFGQAPKFPNEPYHYFLLEYIKLREDKHIAATLKRTLHIMACGGLYDQIGGGFHRYATDAGWLVPHFEKMLYNQANLACIYTEAFLLTADKDFKRIAAETLDYVVREMTCPQGGFYSATDADSEGEEGLYFTWEEAEIDALLGTDATLFKQLYQVTAGGHFEGRNIPHLLQPLSNHADDTGVDYTELLLQIDACKRKLLTARNKRVPPLRDDKIITAWNGMMIKAFALAGNKLERRDYIDAASNAAYFVLNNNRIEGGALSRSSLNGRASVPALQEDYACLAEALLELYDASRNRYWLDQARILADEMLERFRDRDAGGFFMADPGHNNLLPYAPKEIQDNATASGNSVAMKMLGRLSRRAGLDNYKDDARQLVQHFSHAITQRPYISSYMMSGLLELLAGEHDNEHWCCEGRIFFKATTSYSIGQLKVSISVDCAKDWYLNVQTIDSDVSMPLHINIPKQWSMSDPVLPEALHKQVAYQDEPVKVFEGSFELEFCLAPAATSPEHEPLAFIRLPVALQACTNDRCLAPETRVLIIYLP